MSNLNRLGGACGAGALAALAFAGLAFGQDAPASPIPAPAFDSGGTTWMMISSVLVLAMTIPGLALFYGGLVRAKNMLSVLMQVSSILCLVAIIWVVYGYSMTFTDGGSLNAYVGGFSKMFLANVDFAGLDPTKGAATFSNGLYLPELVYILFQMTFACITPALIVGAVAERVKFSGLMVFVALWVTIVYFPIAHMVWYWPGPDGVAAAMAPGGVVMMSSTIDPADAADLGRRLADHGLRPLDAPISGGPVKARDGSMSMMLGSPAPLVAELSDLLADLSAAVFHVGEACGDGAKMKIVNNMLAAVNLAAAGEAMALAERLGLDPRQVYDVVQASSGASFVFGTRMERVVTGDPSVHAAAHILAKDVAIACATARRAASPAPFAELAAEVFRATLAMGLADRDDGAVVEWFRAGGPRVHRDGA